MHSSILLALGAVVSAIAYTPISTSRTPLDYNFANVPFDSHTAYFFLDYIEGVIDAIPDTANKTSFLNASSTFLSAVRKLHTSRLGIWVFRINPGGVLGGYPETKILGVGYPASPR
jgi:hypothetical protein